LIARSIVQLCVLLAGIIFPHPTHSYNFLAIALTSYQSNSPCERRRGRAVLFIILGILNFGSLTFSILKARSIRPTGQTRSNGAKRVDGNPRRNEAIGNSITCGKYGGLDGG